MKHSKKCHDCGGTKVSTSTAAYKMPLANGRWNVTVEDAIITRCPDCGGQGIGLRKLSPMMRAIAAAVVRKPTRLAAAEITFLRLHLGYNGRELAQLLGVGPGTVSRWENGREPIGAVPDRLLRTLEVIREGVDFDVQTLGTIGDKSGAPLKLRVSLRDGEWRAAA